MGYIFATLNTGKVSGE